MGGKVWGGAPAAQRRFAGGSASSSSRRRFSASRLPASSATEGAGSAAAAVAAAEYACEKGGGARKGRGTHREKPGFPVRRLLLRRESLCAWARGGMGGGGKWVPSGRAKGGGEGKGKGGGGEGFAGWNRTRLLDASGGRLGELRERCGRGRARG